MIFWFRSTPALACTASRRPYSFNCQLDGCLHVLLLAHVTVMKEALVALAAESLGQRLPRLVLDRHGDDLGTGGGEELRACRRQCPTCRRSLESFVPSESLMVIPPILCACRTLRAADDPTRGSSMAWSIRPRMS